MIIDTKSPRFRRIVLGVAGTAAALVLVAACGSSAPDAQSQSQSLSERIGEVSAGSVRYPLSQMEAGGWLERTELNTHLLRQNDKNALRYIVLFAQQGQMIAQYPIKGMVFDPNSQLTNTQNLEYGYQGGTNSFSYEGVVDSVGDNGTYGPEAGEAAFFTTNNVEVQISPGWSWIESDAPLHLTSKPLITYDLQDKPSTTAGGDPTATKPGGK